ncbi:MnhB domain-containing protein [Clostridium aestuarii]|uniref:MnhB domain-containing protein n=1 Tax=Clostridium aestuarii TaxID=338193 RepID=A0ABT4D1U1_9CLOT|nr:MnhB domain-containing protein [Clostridium aestuarii]MCY6485222.1 MnhB domain-containing protein [Clostridium aestuarii]
MKDTLLKEISKIVIPFTQIFGIYVIFHGHLSPGGGFAGGTIIGASLILYRIAYGKDKAQEKFEYRKLIIFICSSIMLYGMLKGYSFVSGGSHLHWPQPPLGTPGKILSGGFLLPLNILVGAIVAITMYVFYSLFNEGEV